MSKGTAIVLNHGADHDAVVAAVREKYASQRATAAGWHGTAVVNVKANEEGQEGMTYIVKGLKNGFEVYGLLGAVEDRVKTTAGKFTPA